jgi:hypothetical protein
MTDIPYGDCFTVDARWDIKPLLAPGHQHLQQTSPFSATADLAVGSSATDAGRQASSPPSTGAVGGAMRSLLSRSGPLSGAFATVGGGDGLGSARSSGSGAPPSWPCKVSVNIYLRVPFSRTCMFRRIIESGASKQFKDTYTLLMDELRVALAQVCNGCAYVPSDQSLRLDFIDENV